MFSQSLSRAARSTPPLLHNSNGVASVSWSCSCSSIISVSRSSSHTRRPSSSKASAPPGNGQRNAEAAAGSSEAAQGPTEAEKRPSGRLARRKTKDSAEQTAAKARDEAFANVPAVPHTNHLKEDDVKLSSFFALHRPISVTSPFPSQSTSAKSFSALFDSPKTASTNRINDTIYTLNNAVSALEGQPSTTRRSRSSIPQSAEEKDLRWEIIQQSSSNAEGTQHLDGIPSLDSLVRNFRPFNVPPAPVPIELNQDIARDTQEDSAESAAEQLSLDRRARRRTYATTLTIEEATDSRGETTYTASASPIIRVPTFRRRAFRRLPFKPISGSVDPEGEVTGGRIDQQLPQGRVRPRDMLLISVKRQRKLKMKKHKYKKLMRKTRNLRRRQGRD